MGHPWTYPIHCAYCQESWYEGHEREVDPCRASDGEPLCSPECRVEYEKELRLIEAQAPGQTPRGE